MLETTKYPNKCKNRPNFPTKCKSFQNSQKNAKRNKMQNDKCKKENIKK